MQHIRFPGGSAKSCQHPPEPGPQPQAHPVTGGFTQVEDGRSQQGVLAWLGVLVKRDAPHLVAARQPLDEPQQRRDHTLSPAAVEPAGNNQRKLHDTISRRRASVS